MYFSDAPSHQEQFLKASTHVVDMNMDKIEIWGSYQHIKAAQSLLKRTNWFGSATPARNRQETIAAPVKYPKCCCFVLVLLKITLYLSTIENRKVTF